MSGMVCEVTTKENIVNLHMFELLSVRSQASPCGNYQFEIKSPLNKQIYLTLIHLITVTGNAIRSSPSNDIKIVVIRTISLHLFDSDA